MADDEKAVNAENPGPIDPPIAELSPQPGPHASASDAPSVWTASDGRGPLETAEERRGDSPAEHEAVAASAEPTVEEPVSHAPVSEHPLETETPAVAPSPVAEAPPKRSLVPLAAGIVIGALIGAGSAAIVYTYFGSSGTSGTSTAVVDPQVASLSSRVDALEHKPDQQAAVASLKTAVTDLDGKVAALKTSPSTASSSTTSANTASPNAASPSTAPATPPPPAVDLAPLQQKIAALQAGLDALKAQSAGTKDLETKVATLDSDVAGVKQDVAGAKQDVAGAKKDNATAQTSIASMAGEQKLLADKVMIPALAVVADSLVQQIDQGQPYATQVDALTALGADPAKIAILRQGAETGVPSAKTLAAKFDPLVEPITSIAHKAPPNAGFVDRLKSGMFSMVSVRSVDDTSGTDLPSRVARIQADLAHDDVAAALLSWGALPPDAQAKGDAWSALAKTSADAMSAARALQHDAIVALGAKKS